MRTPLKPTKTLDNAQPPYRLQCRKCRDVIQSMHRHDFKYCKCGSIFIDGGTEYLRCGWKDKNDIIVL